VAAHRFAKWLLIWLECCLIWQIEDGGRKILVLLATIKRHYLGLRRTILDSTWRPATFKNGFCRLLSLFTWETPLTLSAWLGRFWASGLWSGSLTGRARLTHSLRWVLWNRIICLEPSVVINFVLSFVALFVLETLHQLGRPKLQRRHRATTFFWWRVKGMRIQSRLLEHFEFFFFVDFLGLHCNSVERFTNFFSLWRLIKRL